MKDRNSDAYGEFLSFAIETYHSLVTVTRKYHDEQRKIRRQQMGATLISPSFHRCIKRISERLDDLHKAWGTH